jgi:hypothetical protein
MLIDHYNTREKVEELIKLGDLSCLEKNINPDPTKPHTFDYENRQDDVCVAYGRDRGESDVDAKIMSLDEMLQNGWIEYFYVFTQDNEWKFYDCENLELMKDLQQELDKTYKDMGIKRPDDYYGFWTQDSIAREKKKQNTSEGEM